MQGEIDAIENIFDIWVCLIWFKKVVWDVNGRNLRKRGRLSKLPHDSYGSL